MIKLVVISGCREIDPADVRSYLEIKSLTEGSLFKGSSISLIFDTSAIAMEVMEN